METGGQDPFADALGGIPPGIFGFVDKELEYFKRRGLGFPPRTANHRNTHSNRNSEQ